MLVHDFNPGAKICEYVYDIPVIVRSESSPNHIKVVAEDNSRCQTILSFVPDTCSWEKLDTKHRDIELFGCISRCVCSFVRQRQQHGCLYLRLRHSKET
jgi:hypothetical protein